MLTLTESAVNAVRRVLAQSEGQATGLRIAVCTGGCAGYKYSLGLESKAQDDDVIYLHDGVMVFVDPDSESMLQGARVDFVEEAEGAGFVVDNPGVKKVCGCGKSFCH